MLETIIQCPDIRMIRLNDNELNYRIDRTYKDQTLKTVGTVSFSCSYKKGDWYGSLYKEGDKVLDLHSFCFNLELAEEDKKNGTDINMYYQEIIHDGLASSAFELYDIETVRIDCGGLSGIFIDYMSQKNYKIDDNKIILNRSEWFGDKGNLVSLAYFDILGFSNLIEQNGSDVVLNLYRKLIRLIKHNEDFGSPVYVPLGNDCINAGSVYVSGGNINISYASDSFLLWTNYNIEKSQPWWTGSGQNDYCKHPLNFGEPNELFYPQFMNAHSLYLNFLNVCMQFFCQSIVSGIPLRGCIATGLAKLDKQRSIFVGSPLVEAARGESEQNAIGLAYGKSFINHHPIWNQLCIPYAKHKKEFAKSLSPMMVDYPRYWREHYSDLNFIQLVEQMKQQMKTESKFFKYYDKAVDFYNFSKKHCDWADEINWDNIKIMSDFYKKSSEWLQSLNV